MEEEEEVEAEVEKGVEAEEAAEVEDAAKGRRQTKIGEEEEGEDVITIIYRRTSHHKGYKV